MPPVPLPPEPAWLPEPPVELPAPAVAPPVVEASGDAPPSVPAAPPVEPFWSDPSPHAASRPAIVHTMILLARSVCIKADRKDTTVGGSGPGESASERKRAHPERTQLEDGHLELVGSLQNALDLGRRGMVAGQRDGERHRGQTSEVQ